MAKTRKQLHEALRNKFLAHFAELLTDEGEEVLRTKSNEIAIPTLDEEGNEEFVVITFKVPTGSRDDGEAYDGYGVAQQYAEDAEAKREKAKAEAEKKAKKIARDKAQREAKAKARAEHEAAKGEE
jgi:regulator of protease activity HflC (stomatin/prohibitin superfamily)